MNGLKRVRTTITLGPIIHERAKKQAGLESRSLGDLIEDSLRIYLRSRQAKRIAMEAEKRLMENQA